MLLQRLTAETLRAKGVRPTRRRIALFDALRAYARPVAADELQVRVKVQTDLVTVYRALESFVTAGLAREVRFKDATIRYEIVEGVHHHHHVVCTGCGTVDELPNCDIRSLEKAALRTSEKFTSIHEHTLEFFGTCVSCIKR
jgi:Fe2+ or Zn2+ uptake regulation protein